MKAKINLFLRPAIFTAAMASLCIASTAQAVDYTWGGGTHNWTDTSATGWNGGPPVSGDTATINSGTVTFGNATQEDGVTITLGGTGILRTAGGGNYFDGYTSLSFVNGGTLTGRDGNADNYGAGLLKSFTVSGTSASGSVINGTSFNMFNGTVITVDDVTGNSNCAGSWERACTGICTIGHQKCTVGDVEMVAELGVATQIWLY
jgi:hypothetical protein